MRSFEYAIYDRDGSLIEYIEVMNQPHVSNARKIVNRYWRCDPSVTITFHRETTGDN